jgi:hypothetical protein
MDKNTAPATPDATRDVRPQDEASITPATLATFLAPYLGAVLNHPSVKFALTALITELVAPTRPLPKERDLTGPELDRAMGWSAAHRRRLNLRPSYFAGDEERSPRFHLAEVREQLRARGPQRTTAAPAKSKTEDVDVSDVLGRAKLRALTGGRHAR